MSTHSERVLHRRQGVLLVSRHTRTPIRPPRHNHNLRLRSTPAQKHRTSEISPARRRLLLLRLSLAHACTRTRVLLQTCVRTRLHRAIARPSTHGWRRRRSAVYWRCAGHFLDSTRKHISTHPSHLHELLATCKCTGVAVPYGHPYTGLSDILGDRTDLHMNGRTCMAHNCSNIISHTHTHTHATTHLR